jgi:hypothetical protein
MDLFLESADVFLSKCRMKRTMFSLLSLEAEFFGFFHSLSSSVVPHIFPLSV